MLTDDLINMADAAGFTFHETRDLEKKLAIFAFLVAEQRTHRLMSMFAENTKSEIRACSELCRIINQEMAADLLASHAEGFVLDADEMMVRHLHKHINSRGKLN